MANEVSHPLSPEVQWYLDTRGYELPEWCVPLWHTEEPRDVEDVWFDPSRVDRVIEACHSIKQFQGDWYGKPIDLMPWQVAFLIAPVFGWVTHDRDGVEVRYYREFWTEVPRKNGKTTLTAALMLYLAFCEEHGSQAILCASNKDQARLAYEPLMMAVNASPSLQDAGIRAWRSKIERRADNATIKAVASVGASLQGTNPNAYLIDECHVIKDLDLITALETGVGARRQPLGAFITTADASMGAMTPYSIRRDRAESDCRKAPNRRYVCIFAARQEDDPFSEDTWRRANPSWGVTVTKTSMEVAADAARDNPADLAEFLRLRLNVRTKQRERYIDMHHWDDCKQSRFRTVEDMAGRPVVVGMDLASVADLSALCYLTPRLPSDPPDTPLWSAVWRVFTNRDNMKKLDRRTLGAASRWEEMGLLTVNPGNVNDFHAIRDQILADDKIVRLEALGADPWNAHSLLTELHEVGLPVVKVQQSYTGMSSATKKLQQIVYQHELGHDNPIADWCCDNLAVQTDANGNVRPAKHESGEKIDPIVALIIALSQGDSYEFNDNDTDDAPLLV